MRVTIIGTGAMACLFGARLSSSAEVTLVGTWAEGLAAIRERGITVEGAGAPAVARVGAARLGEPVAPADLVLVLVKAWQTERIAGHLAALMKPKPKPKPKPDPEGIGLTLQNGLGNLEILGPRFRLGITTQGATLLGPGRVKPGGAGTTFLAAPERIAELFRNAGFEALRVEPAEAEGLVWAKLAINCAVNPLTAILRVPNGEVLRRPDAVVLLERAAAECTAVARAKGIRLPFPDAADRAKEAVRQSASNLSSMLQDVLRGAPTECEAINGAVVREGRKAGVGTPVNEVFLHLVRSVTKA